MRKQIYLLLSILISLFGYGQSVNKNFKKITNFTGQNKTQPRVGVIYYDDLGNEIQRRLIQSSTDDKDIVMLYEYDHLGRILKEYLPYPSSTSLEFEQNAIPNSGSYYNSLYQIYNPYNQTVYHENSFNQISAHAFSGDWGIQNNRFIRYDYGFNQNDSIINYKVVNTLNGSQKIYENSIESQNLYPDNTLKRIIVKSEDWNPSSGKNNTKEEYSNILGQTVLIRTFNNNIKHDTYVLYDDHGNKVYVIPPIVSKNQMITQTNLDAYCYQYKYDEKNRIVEKKKPGAAWEYMVYDQQNRLVLYQDGNQKAKQWAFTKYDQLDRIVYSGLFSNTATRFAMQTALDSMSENALNNEQFSETAFLNNGEEIFYTKNAFPTGNTLITQVNYYDSYLNTGASGFSGFKNHQPALDGDEKLKGMITATFKNVLGTNKWAKAYYFYDNKFMMPYLTETYDHLGGITISASEIGFDGKIIEEEVKHILNNKETKINQKYFYDNQDRLQKIIHQVNNQPEELLVKNSFDELGRLSFKRVGGFDTTGNQSLQKVDYRYNIRGWLTDINDTRQNQDNDLFNLKIYYNELKKTAWATGAAVNLRYYNGSISYLEVNTKVDNTLRGYRYIYDGLNRLTEADFFTGLILNAISPGHYKEHVTYDKNSNILTLNRTGELENGQPIEIDDLTYSYTGNQLQYVTDETNNPEGFKDTNLSGNDYVYDLAGNLTVDKNKHIKSIIYNHLNLPSKITFDNGTVDFTYDATGKRLGKLVKPTNGALKKIDYVNGFEYENGILKQFPHMEGFIDVTKENNIDKYNYYYIYRDHLGSNRLVYSDKNKDGEIQLESEIIEENNYYPFGLRHKGYNQLSGKHYKYKFLDKELEEDFGLNLTAMDHRLYDNALGRFIGVDALSEMSISYSPYHYGYNNPVYWSDPSGLFSAPYLNSMWDLSDNGTTNWTNQGGYFRSNRPSDSFGNAYNVNFDGTREETLAPVIIEAPRWAFNSGSFNAYALGSFGLGEQIQHHTYTTAALYQGYRDGIRKQQWDDFQSDMDWFGTIPVVGEPIDLANGLISVFRGNYGAAALSAAAVIPIAGNAATAIKIQRHHVIPKAVYKEFAGDLKGIIKRDGKANLMPLPEPYHLGGHKAYNNYVRRELNYMKENGMISPGSIEALQGQLRGVINQGLDNFHKTGENLNTYFKNF